MSLNLADELLTLVRGFSGPRPVSAVVYARRDEDETWTLRGIFTRHKGVIMARGVDSGDALLKPMEILSAGAIEEMIENEYMTAAFEVVVYSDCDEPPTVFVTRKELADHFKGRACVEKTIFENANEPIEHTCGRSVWALLH